MTNPTIMTRSLSEAEVAIADMGAAFADTVSASWERSEPRAVIAGRRFVSASHRAKAAVRAAILAEQEGWAWPSTHIDIAIARSHCVLVEDHGNTALVAR